MKISRTMAALAASAVLSVYAEKGCSSCSSCSSQASKPAKKATNKTKGIAKKTLVTIDGSDITNIDVINFIKSVMPKGQPASDEQINQIISQHQKQIIEDMVNNQLLEKAVSKEGITMSEEEILKSITENFNQMLKFNKMTREEYEQMAKMRFGKSVDDLIKEQSTNKILIANLKVEKLIKKTQAAKLKVDEKSAKEYYETNKATQFTAKEQADASHILIKVDEGADEAAWTKAKTKIDEIAKKIKDGGDFAALAKENSACPSKDKGGSLGKFGRGQMVPPFEKAVFSMKKGDISDVVKTRFGYHIIKCNGRTEGKTTPFAEVSGQINTMLEREKLTMAQEDLVKELRKSAKITYAETAKVEKK